MKIKKHTPFSISPRPGEMYLTPSIRGSLAQLEYIVHQRQGLGLLLGDYGTGKSTILRRLYADLSASEDIRVAFITDPETSSPMAFVRHLCDHFDLPAKRSLSAQKECLREFVFAQGQEGNNCVLMIDEAQSLKVELFDILRSFLNYETDTTKLIQLIIAGQLELRSKLKIPKNRAIKSRVVMTALMAQMNIQDLEAMLRHRCELKGIPFPFDDGLYSYMNQIYEYSSGVPREALRLCANAYQLASLTGMTYVDNEILSMAIGMLERHDGIEIEEEEASADEQIVEAVKP